MKVTEVDESYIRVNLTTICLAQFQKLQTTHEVLELVNVLCRMYSQIQNPMLQVLGHTPGKEL